MPGQRSGHRHEAVRIGEPTFPEDRVFGMTAFAAKSGANQPRGFAPLLTRDLFGCQVPSGRCQVAGARAASFQDAAALVQRLSRLRNSIDSVKLATEPDLKESWLPIYRSDPAPKKESSFRSIAIAPRTLDAGRAARSC